MTAGEVLASWFVKQNDRVNMVVPAGGGKEVPSKFGSSYVLYVWDKHGLQVAKGDELVKIHHYWICSNGLTYKARTEVFWRHVRWLSFEIR